MTTAKEMKESIKLDKASKKAIRYSKKDLGSINKIRINDKTVKIQEGVCHDQVCLLSKSTLYGDLIKELDRLMVGYWNLPDEEQIRILPDKVKYTIRHEVFDNYKNDAEYYEKYEKRAKKPMLINDPSDKVKNVLDVDYLKSSDYVEADFPYVSIGEIMKDKSLSTSEKSIMADRYLEMKERGNVKEATSKEAKGWDEAKDIMVDEFVEIIEETMDDMTMDDEPIEIVAEQPVKAKTIRELYDSLCEMFPRKFHPTKSGHIHYEMNYREKEYFPTLITYDPEAYHKYRKECLVDSKINHYAKSYFIPDNDSWIYFVRTTKGL